MMIDEKNEKGKKGAGACPLLLAEENRRCFINGTPQVCPRAQHLFVWSCGGAVSDVTVLERDC